MLVILSHYLLLEIVRHYRKFVYKIHKPVGLKLLSRLTHGLIRLNKHNHSFSHRFKLIFNPKCLCSLEHKSVSHSFFQYHHLRNIVISLFHQNRNIDIDILNLTNNEVPQIFLYRHSN